MSHQSIDSLLATPYQRSLADEVTNKAKIYNCYFNQLASYTDQHFETAGVMSATIEAIKAIRNQEIFHLFPDSNINALSLQTANAQIELGEAGQRLMETGIPYEGYCELCRRVTDQCSCAIYMPNVEEDS